MQPHVAPIVLMSAVLLMATTTTLLLLVATKWAAYGRGTVAPYRKYSWDFQARALVTVCPSLDLLCAPTSTYPARAQGSCAMLWQL